MLIVGMFFFWVAVTSGLCGFADIFSAHLYALHVVFYSSLLLATLTFAVRLLRSSALQEVSIDDTATRPSDIGSTRTETHAAAPVAENSSAPQGRALVIAGSLVAGMR